jgi:hypothetical protein
VVLNTLQSERPTKLRISNGGRLSQAHILALGKQTQLDALHLRGTWFEQDVEHQLAFLPKLAALREIALDGQQSNMAITVEDCRAIANLPCIATVALTWVDVPPAGVEALAMSPSLTKLTLDGCPCSTAHYAALSKAKHLRSLSLRECSSQNDASIAVLSGANQLHMLDLSARAGQPGELTVKGIRSLAALTQLVRLTIVGHPRLSDDAIDELGKLERLAFLDLSCPDYTNESDRYCARFTGAGIRTLTACKSLTTLAFRRGVTRSPEVMEAFGELGSLRELDLTGTPARTGRKWIWNKPPAIRALVMGSCGKLSSQDISMFAAAGSLRQLDLSYCDLEGSHLSPLEQCTKLTRLNLASTSGVTDATCCDFTRFKQLTELDVSRTDLTSKSMVGLGELSEIKILRMAFASRTVGSSNVARLTTANLVSMFERQRKFIVLDLDGIAEVDDRVLVLVLRSANLVELHLAGCTTITPAGFRALQNLQHLRELDVSGIRFGTDGLPQMQIDDSLLVEIAKMPALVEIRLDNLSNLTINGILGLLRSETISSISIVGCSSISQIDASTIRTQFQFVAISGP